MAGFSSVSASRKRQCAAILNDDPTETHLAVNDAQRKSDRLKGNADLAMASNGRKGIDRVTERDDLKDAGWMDAGPRSSACWTQTATAACRKQNSPDLAKSLTNWIATTIASSTHPN